MKKNSVFAKSIVKEIPLSHVQLFLEKNASFLNNNNFAGGDLCGALACGGDCGHFCGFGCQVLDHGQDVIDPADHLNFTKKDLIDVRNSVNQLRSEVANEVQRYAKLIREI